MQRDGCVGQHLPTFRTGQAVKMKNINYYGQKIIAMPRVKICDAVGKEDRRYRGTQQAAILALFGPVSRCVPSA